MKMTNTKKIAILLACLMTAALSGCGGTSGGDSSTADSALNDIQKSADELAIDIQAVTDEAGEVVTGEDGFPVLENNDFMVKTLEFEWGAKSSSSDNSSNGDSAAQDAPATTTAVAESATTSVVTSYVVVTDAAGVAATDAAGVEMTEVVTQVVMNNAPTGNNDNAPTNNAGDNNNAGNGNAAAGTAAQGNDTSAATTTTAKGGTTAAGEPAATEAVTQVAQPYVPGNDTFQAYWMDMSKYRDIEFNGDFIEVTFRVKENTPDGNYKIDVSNSEFANWDALELYPSITSGCITVGDAEPQVQAPVGGDDFQMYADAVQANVGDEVTVVFHIEDNPGMVAFVFRFQYDSNALEIVNAAVCDDCKDALKKMES